MGLIDCTMKLCICMYLFSTIVFDSVSRWSGLAHWLFAVTSVSRPFLTGLVTSLGFGRHTLFIAVSHHLRQTSDLEEPNSSTYGVIPRGLICTCFAKIEKWLCEIVNCLCRKAVLLLLSSGFSLHLRGSCRRCIVLRSARCSFLVWYVSHRFIVLYVVTSNVMLTISWSMITDSFMKVCYCWF